MDVKGPRRLIEVDLPIREISRQARPEKSIRHGHISTLHIWWARRPLAACRAVVLAALLPDPADPACPQAFRDAAAGALHRFRDSVGGTPVREGDYEGLRLALLGFIARFAAWEVSTDTRFLDCARTLVAGAHPNGPPLVLDPFAGGGAIPLEALRVGADAWAADYNPVAALLLKVVLEDIPRYGERLADAVSHWGAWVKERVEADLGRFYPRDPDGAVPIVYLWARTVTCEGPGCGAEIPLLRQLWLANTGRRQVALQIVVDTTRKHVGFEVVERPAKVDEGTVRRGSAICPVCGFVTPVARVRMQAKAAGELPVRMVAVVRLYPGLKGRFYRVATERDVTTAHAAEEELRRREKEYTGPLSLVPDEQVPLMSGVFNAPIYGLTDWGRYFLPRQALALTAFSGAVHEMYKAAMEESGDAALSKAVATCLAIAVDKSADHNSVLNLWQASKESNKNTFGRQALPMVWDFSEVNPFSGATGDWDGAIEWIEKVCMQGANSRLRPGQATQADARALPLPDASVACMITDPPYYNAVPYADLSDFFYVWLRRSVGELFPDILSTALSPKDGEIAEMAFWDKRRYGHKGKSFFEAEMRRALAEARRVLAPDGIAVVVFAHKTTSGWEAMLQALLDAGWTVTGSWPLDTEMATRLRARDSAALASSVHIVCRPRPEHSGVGDWRQVRGELERRVAEWLPRLSREGVEGADAIFACLGPALEVYSRYERVETAAGDWVPLAQPPGALEAPAFLPSVWAAVAREALRMIFAGPEAEVFEEDARLTALWLWTLRSVQNGEATTLNATSEEGEEPAQKSATGLALDYDTARKLAQALGAHLDDLERPGGIIELRKGVPRLLGVSERRLALLGQPGTIRKRAGTLFEPTEPQAILHVSPAPTTLGRLHQAMLLFADGRGDVLRRLLANPEYGADGRFRQLAQALSSLYPPAAQEKRWVDGVLAVARQMGT